MPLHAVPALSVSCRCSARCIASNAVVHSRVRSLLGVFSLPHADDEIIPLPNYKHLGFGMQWNLAARAVSRTLKFVAPHGLPCSVTPQGTCPPFGSINLTPSC